MRRRRFNTRCPLGLPWNWKEISEKQGISRAVKLLVMFLPCMCSRLPNQLLFDDMNGGQLRDLAMFCMEDEVPRYLCGEYVYTLDLIMSASDSVLSWYTGFGRDFFSVILAYDVYSQASFDEISLLYDAISAHQKSDQAGINILILGLKADADGPGGRVPRETGQAFATERGCSFAECSAKSGHGVYEAFGVVVEYAHSITTHFAGDPEGRKSFIDEIRALFCRVMQSIITTP